MLVIHPGEHGSTFGGNPLGAAVAVRALDVMIEENLIERSNELGNYFMEKLRAIDSPMIEKVRGRGLWIVSYSKLKLVRIAKCSKKREYYARKHM